MGISKLLYIPPRGIGDLIFSLPLLHSIHSKSPDTEIEIPIPNRASLKKMLDLIGFVNPCNIYLPTPSEDPLARERWAAAQAGDNKRRYAAEKQIFEKYLAGQSYDFAILTKPFKIESLDALQISRKDLEESGFDWKNAHTVDGFLAFASCMGIPAIKKFDLNFDKTAKAKFNDGRDIEIQEPYVLFNLGASMNSKKLPATTYTEVASWLSEKNIQSILVGTPEEYSDSEKIKTAGEKVISLLSPTNFNVDLKNYAILASRCRATIGGDSGLLHLADAVGSSAIGLYGPTNPAKFAPYHNQTRVVSKYDSDRNMTNITSKEIISKLEEIIW